MRSRWVVTAAVLLFAALTSVEAVELGVGIRAGTQGIGAELGVGLSKWFALRGGYYGGTVSGDYDDTDISYNGDLTLGGAGVLADFYPMRGGFRLSAGVFSNDTAIELEAAPTGPQEIGGVTYTPAQIGVLNGDVEFDSTAPYFGLGWGRLTGGKRLGFLFDLGVLKQGSGDVILTSSTGLVSSADLESEAAEIEDDIESYEFWPVLSFGMAIRF